MVVHRPATHRRQGAEGVVAAEDGGAEGHSGPAPAQVQPDRSVLLAEPGVEGRGRDGVDVLPQGVDVLERGRQEHQPEARAQTPGHAAGGALDVDLGDAPAAVLGVQVVAAAEEVQVGAELWHRAPVDAELDLRRRLLAEEGAGRLRRGPGDDEAAHLHVVRRGSRGGQGEAARQQRPRQSLQPRFSHDHLPLTRLLLSPRTQAGNGSAPRLVEPVIHPDRPVTGAVGRPSGGGGCERARSDATMITAWERWPVAGFTGHAAEQLSSTPPRLVATLTRTGSVPTGAATARETLTSSSPR